MERISTGVAGLDDMLMGGLIPKRPYVVTGPPGSGKTTLGIHFLMEGIRNNENVMMSALDEPPNEIKANAQSFGFDTDAIKIMDAVPEVRGLMRGGPIVDIGTVLDFRTMRDVRELRPSRSRGGVQVSIHSVQKMIRQEAEDLYEETDERYTRVVIDSLTGLKLFGMKGEDQRTLIQSFFRFLSEMEATVLIITDLPEPDAIDTEVFLARGEIRLHKVKKDDSVMRGISIEKMRGSAFDDIIRPMKIASSGIEVMSNKILEI
ncbi:MAG: hypothetical protein JSW28_05170 [Thermoplasmata archaeon]|nr:MAG: hypothetical protein JSW28_05170 [Thermoplasmata archaeon]